MEQHQIVGATRRAVLAGIAAVLTPVAQAQQRDGTRRLGVLNGGRADDPNQLMLDAALTQALGALGWHEGSNLHIEWRWANADTALFERYAAELVALDPEVLLATGPTEIRALRRQTSTVPIVFTLITDPIGQGLVENVTHPGGTITGFSLYDPPMAGKWLQMLTQITPPVARLAVLYNSATAPYAGLYLHALETAAPPFGVTVTAAPVTDDAAIEAVVTRLAREERVGLLALPDYFNVVHREAIVSLATRYRLPSIYTARASVADGGLMSYGVDIADMFRRPADYIDRILKGAKPGDLPVQYPTKFQLVINLKTAKALGVTIPTTLLATADEVIE